jgi:multidrug efflux pump subunit AcrA (membrane-fusion protein)
VVRSYGPRPIFGDAARLLLCTGDRDHTRPGLPKTGGPATSEFEIRSKVTGIGTAQEFREGQPVTERRMPFWLSAESLRAGSDNARSQVRNAQAELDKATADVARYRPLAEKGTIPRRTLDLAVTARVDFADRALFESTGTFAVAVEFPAPDEVLHLGMVREPGQRGPHYADAP